MINSELRKLVESLSDEENESLLRILLAMADEMIKNIEFDTKAERKAYELGLSVAELQQFKRENGFDE